MYDNNDGPKGKTVREVFNNIFTESAVGVAPVPNQVKVKMLKIKSNQVKDRVVTIGSNHVQFDAYGVGLVPACYRQEVEFYISRNQGFFHIVEEEEAPPPPVPVVKKVEEPVKKQKVEVIKEPIVEEKSSVFDEEVELTEDQKKFLEAIGQLDAEPEVIKPTIVHKKSPGRPKKK